MAVPVNNIGNRILEALEYRQMNQQELADKTGIPKASISQYINGYAKPKDDRIFLMSKALNVTEPWLLGYDVKINNGTIVGNNNGTISNGPNSTSDNSTDSSSHNNNNYTTNNYYSSPCEKHAVNHEIEATINSKEYFFRVLDHLKDMTDEQLLDMIKYAEFISNK